MSQCCHISYYFRDTAGTEKYRSLAASYYRGAHGVFIVYDITNAKSFLEEVSKWIDDVTDVSNCIVIKLHLVNKYYIFLVC